MFHSGVEFVPLFDFCGGLTNVISEFILIFKRSKKSTPKENDSVDDGNSGDSNGDGGGGDDGGTGDGNVGICSGDSINDDNTEGSNSIQ